MCFFRKVDLERGRKVFFENHGALKWAYRDFPEWYDCNVPKKITKEWTNEIEKQILNEIAVSYGKKLHLLFVNLSGLYIPLDKEIQTIVECLSNKKLDTFTTLILCETLKEKCKKKTKETIRYFAKKMLNEPIIIDETYVNSIASIKTTFNVTNINQYFIDRIQKLSEHL